MTTLKALICPMLLLSVAWTANATTCLSQSYETGLNAEEANMLCGSDKATAPIDCFKSSEALLPWSRSLRLGLCRGTDAKAVRAPLECARIATSTPRQWSAHFAVDVCTGAKSIASLDCVKKAVETHGMAAPFAARACQQVERVSERLECLDRQVARSGNWEKALKACVPNLSPLVFYREMPNVIW